MEYQTLVFGVLKTDLGRIGLASVEKEVAKLESIQKLLLPDKLFTEHKKWRGSTLAKITQRSFAISSSL